MTECKSKFRMLLYNYYIGISNPDTKPHQGVYKPLIYQHRYKTAEKQLNHINTPAISRDKNSFYTEGGRNHGS